MSDANVTDATKILKDMLKIGTENSVSDDGEISSANENQERTQSESSDSFHEQDSPRVALNAVTQPVRFSLDEQKGSVIIYGNDVHITTGEYPSRSDIGGSNRVRYNQVVKFDWESKYYNGNLLTVSAKYMVYALRGKSGFVLRILHRNNASKTLIKGFTGTIEDVAFVHYNSDIFACIDSAGDVFVWSINEKDDKLIHTLKLHLKRTSSKLTFPEGCRLTWCPYIEETDSEDTDNEAIQVLAITVGNVAEVINVAMIIQTYGVTVDTDDVKRGIIVVEKGHKKVLTDIALAPDGSVLATASEDGGVKFWKLNFELSEHPGCLHEWQPHEGKPLSRLIFCDNLLLQDDKSPFWRFLLTGAEHNSELKIWCTVTWTCLQTIRFELPAASLSKSSALPLKFKVSLDLSAKYLVVSDVNRKVLYVFLLHEDLDEGKAHVTSVAQFPLTQPILSFVITEAKTFKASVRDSLVQNGSMEGKEKPENDMEELYEDEEETKLLPTIKIKLHCIDPKALQELTVQYHPFASIRPKTPSTIADVSMTSCETGVQDGLSDMSVLDTSSTEESEKKQGHTPKLIAPEAFTSTHVTSAEPSSSITSVTSMNNSSYTSISVEELLGNSNTMSETAFETCDEATLQGAPSPKPFPVLSGEATSPLGVPLPESPDPLKIPIPAFQPHSNERKKETVTSMSHSTPINRQSVSREGQDDKERTPTAQDSLQSIHDDQEEELVKIPFQNGLESEAEISSTLLKPDDLGKGQSSKELEFDKQSKAKPIKTNEEQSLMQNTKLKTHLTVTPRKQINILPDQDQLQTEATTNEGNNTAMTNSQLEEIISILRAQQTEISQLKDAMQSRSTQQNQSMCEVLREEVAMLESVITKKVETILAEHAKEQDQRLDSLAQDKQSSNKQKNDKLADSVSNAVANRTEKAVKNEVRNSVNSGFQKLTASLQDQMNTTMAQKLTVTDNIVKESVSKMVVDKNVIDAIGEAVGTAVQKRLHVFIQDFTTSTMLPGFDRACQALFTQINTAFQKGTQQYIHSFESFSTNQIESHKEQRDPIIQQLQTIVQAFQQTAQLLSKNMADNLMDVLQSQLSLSMNRLQSNMMSQLKDDLNRSIQETIQKEVRSSMVEHRLPEPMGHSSPQVQHRTQQRIKELINIGNFSDAFREALTASDLSLVVMVCGECDPVDLFSQIPCPLDQPTILSLIQQLSVDLSTDTKIKHSYLSEAVLALDTDNPITKEHVVIIISTLCQQIKTTMESTHKNDIGLQRQLKRLLMEAKSLMK